MDWQHINWLALDRLRTDFLQGAAGGDDYWSDESTLASYDATFAQRIGWKWDYVLAELSRRGWSPPAGEVLDWGCGSGIAGRAFVDHFGMAAATALRVWDRSTRAMNFAAGRARGKYPGLAVHTGGGEVPGILLLSHVLTELKPDQAQALADFAATAQCLIWVEPGTFDASLRLIAIRERLRAKLSVIAPCTHQERCGVLAPENERHWCHHFASPPREVFQDRDWSRFASLLGIDLRDLPLSFLVMDRRPTQALPAGVTRIIGHPRIYKPHALLLGCDASGVSERRLTRRALPTAFKRLKKDGGDGLQVLQCEGREVVRIQPLSGSREDVAGPGKILRGAGE